MRRNRKKGCGRGIPERTRKMRNKENGEERGKNKEK
jgi:hypothetical protein